jgi:hypothetical protein
LDSAGPDIRAGLANGNSYFLDNFHDI